MKTKTSCRLTGEKLACDPLPAQNPEEISKIRETPPGLIQHVLTVLVFWSWVLLRPRLPPSPRSFRLFPRAGILWIHRGDPVKIVRLPTEGGGKGFSGTGQGPIPLREKRGEDDTKG